MAVAAGGGGGPAFVAGGGGAVVVGSAAAPIATREASSHWEVSPSPMGHSGLECVNTVTVEFWATVSTDISRQADPEPTATGLMMPLQTT